VAGTALPPQHEIDAQHLASLGYRQELRRSLGMFSNFAVAFSYISVSTGTFALFALGIGTGGPAFFWSWPLVAAGQLFVALNFAELASHFPVAGSIYQWSRRLASPGTGWMIGWFYLGATLLTITAVAFTLPLTLTPIFGWPLDVPTEVKIALGAIVLTSILNIAGIRILALINNLGVAAEIAGMFVFAVVLLIVGHHQSLGVFVDPAGTQHTPGAGMGYVGVFLAAMFMSLFVIYGFDTAGSLGEETVNPRREAPRALIIALLLSFAAGFLFLGASILAIKNVPAIMKVANGGGLPLPDIITGALGSFWGNVYLAVVSIAIFVCLLSIQAAATRLVFSMSRDRRLPLSQVWSAVHPVLGTPIPAVLITGIIGALPLIVSQQIGVIATGATGLIYLSYWLTNLVLFNARRRGWPSEAAPFSLGRWSMIVNVLALVWGGSMLINFAWFRDSTNPPLSAAFTRLSGVPVLGGTPIFELSVAVLLILGGAYWLLVQRHRSGPDTPVEIPPQVERVIVGGP
jgi:urea carboxylase system permease